LGYLFSNPEINVPKTPPFFLVSPIFKLLGNSHMRETSQIAITRSDHTDTQILLAWIAGSFLDLESRAQDQVDSYWEDLKSGRDGRKPKDRGNLGLRLRSRANGSFSVEWYKCGFLGNSNRSIARGHIRKGRNNRYPMRSVMNGQPDWLISLISETEDVLSEIRKRQALLVRIRNAASLYTKHVGDQPPKLVGAVESSVSRLVDQKLITESSRN
jgi:MobI protein